MDTNALRAEIEREFSTKVYPNVADPMVHAAFDAGVAEFVRDYLGKVYPWVLNGHRVYYGEEGHATSDPADPKRRVGRFPVPPQGLLDIEKVTKEIRAAGRRFFLSTTWEERAKLLRTISEVAKERFWLLVAAKMWETGQPIPEAIGETDEEVDFPLVNAYALAEKHTNIAFLRMQSPPMAGDFNGSRYVPHGLFLNKEPFNFPGAIPKDMATKALSMGNAVIMSASPKASLCGFLAFETIIMAFERCGIDWRGVVNYAPGDASVADRFLYSPYVSGLSFTGSTKVFRDIKRNHGERERYGWTGMAPLVYGSAETSGINFAIIDREVELRHAANEHVKSFFGRSGQKCSSGRLALVHKDDQEEFVREVIRAMEEDWVYGDVKEGASIGPVITGADKVKLQEQLASFTESGFGSVLHRKNITPTGGHDFAPTLLLADPLYRSEKLIRDALLSTEFFGPISTIVPWSSEEDISVLCREARFALTGSVFSNDPRFLRKFLDLLPAGNKYVNRKCTGALVETECFGGVRSASSPNGMKGLDAFALFSSNETLSGRYAGLSKEETATLLQDMGFRLAKK